MDIAKHIGPQPLGKVKESALGPLLVFSLSFGELQKFYKDLGKTVRDVSPSTLAKTLSIYTCFPETSLEEPQRKPTTPVLSKEKVEELTEQDLEAIAQVYVENSPDRSGTPSREPEESNLLYLQRYLIAQEQQLSEQMAKLLAPLSMFSKNLRSTIGATLARGEAIKESVSPIVPARVRLIPEEFTKINYQEIEEKRLAPFRELRDRLDAIVSVVGTATEFQVEAHKTQVGIAEELKTSGDKAGKFSKYNIWLSSAVLVIAVITLAASIVFRSADTATSRRDSSNYARSADEALGVLKDIRGISSGAVKDQERRIQRLEEERLLLMDRIKSLEGQVSRQRATTR